jgi:hypothetical protein
MLGANMECKIARAPNLVPKGQRALRVSVNQERSPRILGHIAPQMRGKGALSRTTLTGSKNQDIHDITPILSKAILIM